MLAHSSDWSSGLFAPPILGALFGKGAHFEQEEHLTARSCSGEERKTLSNTAREQQRAGKTVQKLWRTVEETWRENSTAKETQRTNRAVQRYDTDSRVFFKTSSS